MCDICIKANIKQRKFAHSGERSDDGLPACEMCGQMFSTDEVIVAKEKDKEDAYKVSCNKDTRAHTIRDVYSGNAAAICGNNGDSETLKEIFIWFAGIRVNQHNVRHALLKTDNAPALIKAIKE